jgi:hypothetical protein
MPWFWSDAIFKLSADGREHDQCLKVIHGCTANVIKERATAFQIDQAGNKRLAFLGKFS